MRMLNLVAVDFPMLAGVTIGFLLLTYLFMLGQIFALADLRPLAFFFATIGMAMFCSVVGVMAGVATTILLDPKFFAKYTREN